MSWSIEVAGPERADLSVDGQLSESNMTQFNIYRIVTPNGLELERGDQIEVYGTLVCSCGYRVPLDADLGIKGFMDYYSKRSVACPQCNALTMVVGTSTDVADATRYWLLVTPETGPPGESYFPGTPSGLPELELEEVGPAE